MNRKPVHTQSPYGIKQRLDGGVRQGASAVDLAWEEHPGDGAFYGPKLEFLLHDNQGRPWQCGTIQVDFVMPERFDLNYIDSGGARKRPVMLHRALYGSLERFMGVLLEHHGAELPPWLAPEQVRVLPIGQDHTDYAAQVYRALVPHARAHIDARSESLGRRIADAHMGGVPLVVVVGGREQEQQAASVRFRNTSRPLPLAEAIAEISRLCAAPTSP